MLCPSVHLPGQDSIDALLLGAADVLPGPLLPLLLLLHPAGVEGSLLDPLLLVLPSGEDFQKRHLLAILADSK